MRRAGAGSRGAPRGGRRGLRKRLLVLWLLAGCAAPQVREEGGKTTSQAPIPRKETSSCCELEPPAAHHLRFLTDAERQARYRFRLVSEPPRPLAGQQALISVYVESAGEGAGSGLGVHRERRIHLTVVSDNLAELHHFHPEDVEGWREMSILDGCFTAPVVFASGGVHRIFVDFAEDGIGVQASLTLDVEGPPQEALRRDTAPIRSESGLEISLETVEQTLVAGKEVNGVFRVRQSAQPTTDLDHDGGALAHILVLGPTPDGPFLHLHGGGQEYSHFSSRTEVAGYSGPKLYWSGLLDPSGFHRVFLWIRRAGEAHAVPFDLQVLGAGDTSPP